MSVNNGIVFAILLCLALFSPTIWLSVTAKPIGRAPLQKSYRWGTWVALGCAITSLSFLAPAMVAFNLVEPVVAIEYLLPVIALVATCILLLNRKRIGVVMFFVSYIVLIVLNLLGPLRVGELALFRQKTAAGGIFLYVVINGVYFARRWELFEPPTAGSRILNGS